MDKRTKALVGIGGVVFLAVAALAVSRQRQKPDPKLEQETIIDAMLEDSFPASDPPNWSPAMSASVS